MGARYADRLWKIGGLVVVVVLVVGSWFLLISPKFAEADEVRTQTADTQTQLITLRKRISELKKQQANLTAMQAELRKKQKALPSDSGVPAFLRQLQASGEALSVNVTGVSVSAPVQQTNLPAVWALPITMTADGSADDLGEFLQGLQSSAQSRAVLIETASLSPQASSTAADGASDVAATSVNLTLKAFVAPPAGTGTPTVTTK
jgi:type IV pilus assembly protein PilO